MKVKCTQQVFMQQDFKIGEVEEHEDMIKLHEEIEEIEETEDSTVVQEVVKDMEI